MKAFAVLLALTAAFLITPAFAQHHEWHGQHGTGGQHRIDRPHYGGYWSGYGYRPFYGGYGGYQTYGGCYVWDGHDWRWRC